MWPSTQSNFDAYEAIPIISAKMPQAPQRINTQTRRPEVTLYLVGVHIDDEGRTRESRFPCTKEAWIRMAGEPGEYRFLHPLYKKHDVCFTYYKNTETGLVEFFDMYPNFERHPNRVMTSEEVLDDDDGRYMLKNTIELEVFGPELFINVKGAPLQFRLEDIQDFTRELRRLGGGVTEQQAIPIGSFNVRVIRVENEGRRIKARIAQRSRATLGGQGTAMHQGMSPSLAAGILSGDTVVALPKDLQK